MKKTHIILIFVIILASLAGYFFWIQKSEPARQLSNEQLRVKIGKPGASVGLFPGMRPSFSVLIPIVIENNSGFDLNNLRVEPVEVKINGELLGSFESRFQTSKGCRGKIDRAEWPSELNLLDGCKLQFNVRIDENVRILDRVFDDDDDFEGSVQTKFRFVTKDYYSDYFETGDMSINVVE